MALGVGGYLGKFFVFSGMTSAKSAGEFLMGLIGFLVGLLEFLSEFIRIIAYTFRLFGNIFAGEVMLLVIMFLVPLIVVTPLIGFEIFVNIIQAFIFYILSVAFYTVAITGHGDHDESHEAHH
jgi:F-type H+-transporting ATPase subunit a